MDIHIKIRYRGRPDAIKRWHNFMHWVDADWPYVNPTGKYGNKTRVCANCKGRHYVNARFAPEDIKRAAKMFGVKVKIDRFVPVGKCFPGDLPESYTHLIEEDVKGVSRTKS